MSTNLSINQQAVTWGGAWRSHMADRGVDTNVSSEARRLKIKGGKLRSWLVENRSPSVDYMLARRKSMPASVKAAIINALAEGEFVVTPIESKEGCADPAMAAVALLTPVSELQREIVAARADDIITEAEAHRIREIAFRLIADVRAIYVAIVVLRLRRVCSRIWRQA